MAQETSERTDTGPTSPAERHSQLELLSRTLEREGHILMREPEVLPSHLHNMLFLEEGEDGPAGLLLTRAREALADRPWLRLTNRPPVERSVLNRVLEHGATVWAVAWSPDGALVASAGGDGRVRLWDPDTGRPLAVLEAHVGQVNALAWSPDGDTVASGHDDGSVRLWDQATFRERAVLEGHTDGVLALAWSSDGTLLASAGADGTVQLWDPATEAGKPLPEGHTGIIYALAWSPDGALLASGGADNTVRLWKRASGEQHAVLEDRGLLKSLSERVGSSADSLCNVVALAWSPDGRYLASGSRVGTVQFWDPATGAPRPVGLDPSGGGVWSLAWAPDEPLLAWGGSGLGLGHPVMRKQLRFPVGQYAVHALAWSPDGRTLASGSEDKTVRLWDARTLWDLAPSMRPPPRGHDGPVYGLAWSWDGTFLASGGGDNTVRLWGTTTGAPEAVTEQLYGPVFALASSPDGVLLAPFNPKEATVALLQLGPDGPKAMIRETLPDLMREIGALTALASSPDGRLLAAGDLAGSTWVWDRATARLAAVLRRRPDANARTKTKREPSPVWALSWSPDGTLLAAASRDAMVVWNLTTGKEQVVLEEMPSEAARFPGMGPEALPIEIEAHALAWSPDGTLLASGSRGKSIRLCEGSAGKQRGALEGHTGWPHALAWSPDGVLLASGSRDKTVRLWEPASEECRGVAHCLSSVRALQFSNDGHILRAADDGAATGNRPLPYLFELCNIEIGPPVAPPVAPSIRPPPSERHRPRWAFWQQK